MTGPDVETALGENTSDLHAYLLRRLHDPDDAGEALSDVMLTAWRRRDRMPVDAHEARLWLYGIAANTHRNHHRARTRRGALVRRLMSDPTARRSTEDRPDFDHVRDAIDALPADLGELVRLHHWEGFSLAEVATIMSVPPSTVRTRYAAARRRLRSSLRLPEDEPGHLGARR